jgi:hypothetical protein
MVGEVAEPIGLCSAAVYPASCATIERIVPFFIFGDLPGYGLFRAIGSLTIALHLELCTSPNVALIVEVLVVVGEGELIVP